MTQNLWFATDILLTFWKNCLFAKLEMHREIIAIWLFLDNCTCFIYVLLGTASDHSLWCGSCYWGKKALLVVIECFCAKLEKTKAAPVYYGAMSAVYWERENETCLGTGLFSVFTISNISFYSLYTSQIQVQSIPQTILDSSWCLLKKSWLNQSPQLAWYFENIKLWHCLNIV